MKEIPTVKSRGPIDIRMGMRHEVSIVDSRNVGKFGVGVRGGLRLHQSLQHPIAHDRHAAARRGAAVLQHSRSVPR